MKIFSVTPLFVPKELKLGCEVNIQNTANIGIKRTLSVAENDTIKMPKLEHDSSNSRTQTAVSQSETICVDENIKSTDAVEVFLNSAPLVVSNENPTWAVCNQDIFLTTNVVNVIQKPSEDSGAESDGSMPEIGRYCNLYSIMIALPKFLPNIIA